MGNNFSAFVRNFINGTARSGILIFNLFRQMVNLPLYPNNLPSFFRGPAGSGIAEWEESGEHIGSVKINWYEDASKCILYVFCFNPIMDRVVTFAAFQAKRFPALTEVFIYYTAPDTEEVVGIKFRTAMDIHELKNIFTRTV